MIQVFSDHIKNFVLLGC